MSSDMNQEKLDELTLLLESAQSQIESMIDKDYTYKCYEKEIKELTQIIRGLERIVKLSLSDESNEISRHNANKLWQSYLVHRTR